MPKEHSMQSIPYLRKKIGSSNLLWFENSNSYVQLEEPAWYVFNQFLKRCKPKTIAKAFENRYGTTHNESLTFVTEILTQIGKLNQRDTIENNINNFSDRLNEYHFNPYTIHHYLLGTKQITFAFESRLFEYYIHPLISHLEIVTESETSALLELFQYQGKIVFRLNGEVRGVWSADETHLVKGLIFMAMINLMHTKTDADWLMTVHASAITNKRKTILFSAPPGSGKTTMAALLQSRGFELISDDFVPIDRQSFSAYPFPIAMSVKQGSMELLIAHFPALEHKQLNHISSEKSVRYLAAEMDPVYSGSAYPVHEMVFIEYNDSVDFVFEKLAITDGIKLLLDQAWVVPNPGNSGILLDWITSISFFKLTYSNNEKGINAITELFSHE